MKKARCKRPPTAWFFSQKTSRKGKSIEAESTFMLTRAEEWGEKGRRGKLNVLKLIVLIVEHICEYTTNCTLLVDELMNGFRKMNYT